MRVDWRRVPVEPEALTSTIRRTAPEIHQARLAFDAPEATVERALFRARLGIDRALAEAGVAPVAIVSLSTATVVYKALVVPAALPRFYPDLADPAFESPFVVFHQRFSTNTAADWALAQPFRTTAHNGEINTIAGNRRWFQARAADTTSLPGFAGVSPVCASGSDSQSLDDAIGLMRAHGYSLAHAVARLLPPSWERDRDLAGETRAFFEFQSLVSEPWDGPAALVFSDGRQVGAALDRNGFRPARVVRTIDGLVAVASEVGILDRPSDAIADRSRLGPGQMVVVDLARRTVLGTAVLRRLLSHKQPYRHMVDAAIVRLPRALPAADRRLDSGELTRCQTLFGYSREEIDVILRPMAADGHEAVGSMGDDTPPAVLSSRDRVLPDFFRQRFAQVTNPPIDPYREAGVMSLRALLGAHGSFLDEAAPRPARVALSSPILAAGQLTALTRLADLPSTTLSMHAPAAEGAGGFAPALDRLIAAAIAAVEQGDALLVLSDRDTDADHAPLPALLATAAVHQALVEAGVRLRASLVVDTGEARDAHQIAALCAYGASAVCPWLAYETIAALGLPDGIGQVGGTARYRLGLERGLLRILSKMGVCTFSGYCGAGLFEVLGLDRTLVNRFFPGTPSPVGGLTLGDVAGHSLVRHARAYATAPAMLRHHGAHGYRSGGDYHAVNPLVVKKLHRTRTGGQAAYEEFSTLVHSRPPASIRDLIEFAPREPIALEAVDSEAAICRRFFASAMSVGALGPEAHRAVAVAMNRLGARSNSGEGGEEPERFERPEAGDWSGSRTKQVASARFGVTPGYLRSADELQIKIAQGSKPGEGGQLPGVKVVPHIARLRHAQPGTPLISPPVHHDVYSIEDLAQLISDLRAVHPSARINVKLVATTGVGIIAAGVVKAGADAIQISGHDGGTGASPRSSIKHAGLPWEIGVAEAQQVLTRQGLRSRVVLQTDGGFKTGRDVAVAAALGAEEYGFGTAALVAVGCVMARQCHLNTCPAGIATQRPDLRARFTGTPEMLVSYLRLVAGETRQILAALGLKRLDNLIGRADLLRARRDGGVSASRLDLSPLFVAARPPRQRRRAASAAAAVAGEADLAAASPGRPLVLTGTIRNTDRAYGAAIAGSIAARRGDAGLREGSIRATLTGSAGQSFGAFLVPGMRLSVVGEANDYLGKGMHGGEIVVRPPARQRGRQRQALVGNTVLYGATGGRVFIAGAAGERFAIRNSGATAVVEGVGDHGCEYMTGGVVLILGAIGRNFGAGMTGGVAYVHDPAGLLARHGHAEMPAVHPVDATDREAIRRLLLAHRSATQSRLARALLRGGDDAFLGFRKVDPLDAARRTADAARQRTARQPQAVRA